MAVTQNGWAALTTAPSHVGKYITGRLLPGDVATVLEWVCEQFDKRVEKIDKAQSWGWAYRANANNKAVLSNHASGTAVDLNASKHPNGVKTTKTFSDAQIKEVHKILTEAGGVVRWGGDYPAQYTPDAMHFEINSTPVQVALVAKKLAGTSLSTPVASAGTGQQNSTSSTTATTKEVYQMLPTLDLRNADKKLVTGEAVKVLQGLLLAHGYGPVGLTTNGRPDGNGGAATKNNLGSFQQTSGLDKDYVVGSNTWKKLLNM